MGSGRAEAGELAFRNGLMLAAKEFWTQWLQEVEGGAEAPGELVRARNALGTVALELGENPLATRLFCDNRDLVQALKATGDAGHWLSEAVRVDTNLSVAQYLGGDLASALRVIDGACDAAAAAVGAGLEMPAHRLGRLYQQAGVCSIAHQRWQRALDLGSRALGCYIAEGDDSGAAQVLLNLAVASAGFGAQAEAEAYLQHAASKAREVSDYRTLAYCHTEAARAALTHQDQAGAIDECRLALHTLWLLFETLDKPEVARICEVFGLIAMQSGDHKRGVSYLERASIYYAHSNMWREWSEANRMVQAAVPPGGSDGRSGAEPSGLPDEEVEVLEYFTSLLGLLDLMEGMYPGLKHQGDLTTRYSLLLADHLGLPDPVHEVLSHASRLHDIGLTSVDMELVGEGRDAMSGAAQKRLEAHPRMGEQTLASFPIPPDTLLATRSHHENFDGTGYPDGLVGEAIPLVARILGVAEEYVVGAQSQGHAKGLERIVSMRGSRLDPAFVDAFVAMHDE